GFDWNDYRTNYMCTVVASLMHPKVNTYEICPWPNRIFEDEYPKDSPDKMKIPDDYRTVLNNTFNTLGTLELGESSGLRIGILTGDCQLYQREYPDSCFPEEDEPIDPELKDFASIVKNVLFKGKAKTDKIRLQFASSYVFPGFFSLALPLLKYGVPVRPVLLDNARRYTGYLDDYDVLILSYEFMKPEYPDINATLAEWVKQGGTIIYVGDGWDPFNNITSWWTGKYANPAEHLFEMLGIEPKNEKEIFKCLKGTAAVWNHDPCKICYTKENADEYRKFFVEVIGKKKNKLEFKNNFIVERDPYIVAAVMDESINEDPVKFNGLFVDMFSPAFDVIEEMTLYPNDRCMLLDLAKVKDDLAILGTSVRIFSLEQQGDSIVSEFYGAGDLKANIRIKVPFKVSAATVDDEKVKCIYDEKSKTVLVSFNSVTKRRKLVLK
ncbi:MAG: hypothetical protein IJS17_03055, partial [Clostridia bacterium]|nr:hypothetical protein [Clostridia bacterium]